MDWQQNKSRWWPYKLITLLQSFMLCLVRVKNERLWNGRRKKERKMSFSIIWLEWKGRWKKMGGWSFLPKPPFCPPSKLVRKEEKMAMRRTVQYYVHFTFFYFAPVWSLERKRRYEKEVWVVNITIWLIVQWGCRESRWCFKGEWRRK